VAKSIYIKQKEALEEIFDTKEKQYHTDHKGQPSFDTFMEEVEHKLDHFQKRVEDLKEKKLELDQGNIKEGTVVYHKNFGNGIVKRMWGVSLDKPLECIVAFKEGHPKRILYNDIMPYSDTTELLYED